MTLESEVEVEERFAQFAVSADKLPVVTSSSAGDEAGQKELDELKLRYEKARARKHEAQGERYKNAEKMREGTILRDELNVRINSLERKYREMVEDTKGLEKDNDDIALQLERYMQIYAMNDFYCGTMDHMGLLTTFDWGTCR